VGFAGIRSMRCALFKFATWLRAHFEFPIAFQCISLLVICPDAIGPKCSASFFARGVEVQSLTFRIATGDYTVLRAERGRNERLLHLSFRSHTKWCITSSWVATGEVWIGAFSRRASRNLGTILPEHRLSPEDEVTVRVGGGFLYSLRLRSRTC
jgi:hypothetical protein